jgi:hypothetical protein
VEANIVVLCPNHHAELDLGVRKIAADTLKRIKGHAIGVSYVRYHNKNIATS